MFTGMDVFGRSVTAETVGGDAFDFIPYPESQLGISISDAKGKGLPAALLAVAHHAMVHALVSVELRLRSTFSRVSDLLARSLPPGNFITTFYGIIDITERRIVYVNAGHPPPLLVRANGHTEVLPPRGRRSDFHGSLPSGRPTRRSALETGLSCTQTGSPRQDLHPTNSLRSPAFKPVWVQLWSRRAQDVCQGLFDEAARRSGGAFVDDATVVVVKFD